ncbi:Asp-tRNA(Asn)/Glu-tRNA(Gln) amidotransferase subunit GatC [Desulfurispora thermophila]|uniref:Asp-tRNA(Asn)/Glu-tRNA(Gln) amidotransferase subunit GatC n=1 Tax=Desulfurispora thermophila TaxID=265470 RepID=UPI003F603AE8
MEQVEHVALLARLALTPEEKELYSRQLSAILEYARKLEELDVSDVPPTAHVLPLRNVLRQDQVGAHMPPEEALANAPEREENYFKVPRIV